MNPQEKKFIPQVPKHSEFSYQEGTQNSNDSSFPQESSNAAGIGNSGSLSEQNTLKTIHSSSSTSPKSKSSIPYQGDSVKPELQLLVNQPRVSCSPKDTKATSKAQNSEHHEAEPFHIHKKTKNDNSSVTTFSRQTSPHDGNPTMSSSYIGATSGARPSSTEEMEESDESEVDEDHSSNKKPRTSLRDAESLGNPKSTSQSVVDLRSSPSMKQFPGRGVVSPGLVGTRTRPSAFNLEPVLARATPLAVEQGPFHQINTTAKAPRIPNKAATSSAGSIGAEQDGGIFDDAEEDFQVPSVSTMLTNAAKQEDSESSDESSHDGKNTAMQNNEASVSADMAHSQSENDSNHAITLSGSYLLPTTAVSMPIALPHHFDSSMQLPGYPYAGIGIQERTNFAQHDIQMRRLLQVAGSTHAGHAPLQQLAFLQSLSRPDSTGGRFGTAIQEPTSSVQMSQYSDSDVSNRVDESLPSPEPDRSMSVSPETMTRVAESQKMPKSSKSSDAESPQRLPLLQPRPAEDDGVGKLSTSQREQGSGGKPMKGKRKRPKEKGHNVVLPTPGVTTSPKDRKIAEATLSGADDLLSILSEEDCRFLGSRFWIFTIQQLEHVLHGGKLDGAEDDAETGRNTAEERGKIRSLLTRELAKHALHVKMKDDRAKPFELVDNGLSPEMATSPQMAAASDGDARLRAMDVGIKDELATSKDRKTGENTSEIPSELQSNGHADKVPIHVENMPAMVIDGSTGSATVSGCDSKAEESSPEKSVEMPSHRSMSESTSVGFDMPVLSASRTFPSKDINRTNAVSKGSFTIPEAPPSSDPNDMDSTNLDAAEQPTHVSQRNDQPVDPMGADRRSEDLKHITESGDALSSAIESNVAGEKQDEARTKRGYVSNTTDISAEPTIETLSRPPSTGGRTTMSIDSPNYSTPISDQASNSLAKETTSVVNRQPQSSVGYSSMTACPPTNTTSTMADRTKDSAMETSGVTRKGLIHSARNEGNEDIARQTDTLRGQSSGSFSVSPSAELKDAGRSAREASTMAIDSTEQSTSSAHRARALNSSAQEELFKRPLEKTGDESADTIVTDEPTKTTSSTDQAEDVACEDIRISAKSALKTSSGCNIDSPLVAANDTKVDDPTQAIDEQLNMERFDETLDEAEIRVENWERAIRQWRNQEISHEKVDQEKSSTDLESRFPLRGPLSCLFSTLFQNFLTSMGIVTAFSFLSAKKTEASGLIYAFQLWRVKCDMPPLRASTLARNMLGLTARLKTALTSIPPADERTRTWMGCQLVVLTGAAKEFLIDTCRLDNAELFVNSVTKDLSDRMVAWRETKNLPPLKGSGKIAMISAWKTSVRETIEAEEGVGKVLAEGEFLSEKICPFPLDPGTRPTASRGRSVSTRQPAESKSSLSRKEELDTAIESPTFLAECLKADIVSFLATQGITNAKDLLGIREMPTSPVMEALTEFVKKDLQDGVDALQTSCIRWGVWVKLVEDKLKEVSPPKKKRRKRKRQKSRKKQASNDSTLPKNLPCTLDCEDIQEQRNESKSDDTISAPPGAEDGKASTAAGKEIDKQQEVGVECMSKEKESDHNEVQMAGRNALQIDEDKGIKNTNEKKGKSEESPNCSVSGDAINVLSKTARRFLADQGIRSADDFLSAKTSIVARAFVEWREKQNMSVLKGQGSIASISGWKGIVRKASESGSQSLAAKAASPKRHTAALKQIDIMMHPQVLMGLPYREITMCSRDGVLLYDFKLSVRKSVTNARQVMGFPPGAAVFLSYMGSRQRDSKLKEDFIGNQTRSTGTALIRDVSTSEIENPKDKDIFLFRSVPVLSEMSTDDIRKEENEEFSRARCIPFSSTDSASGLIELGIYGVHPFVGDREHVEHGHGIVEELQHEIRRFIGYDIETFGGPGMKYEPSLSPTGATSISSECPAMEFSTSLNEGNSSNAADGAPTDGCGANVFPVETRHGMQYFFYHAEPMEKGQTIELRFYPEIQSSTDDCVPLTETGIYADLDRRVTLEKHVSSLSLQELKSIHLCLRSSIGKPIIAEASRVMKLEGERIADNIERSSRPCQEKVKYFVARRRLHWVASIVKAKINSLYGTLRTMKSTVLAKAVNGVTLAEKSLDSFLWNMSLTDALSSVQDDGMLFDAIRDEVAAEVVAELTRKGLVKWPFDKSIWCPMASLLFRRCLEHVATYALKNDFNLLTSQQSLMTALQSSVSKGVKALLSKDADIDNFVFSSNVNSLGMTQLPKDSDPVDYLMVAPGPSTHEEATGRIRIRECSEQCTCKDVFALAATDFRTRNASLHARWYIEHQILPVVHAVAMCSTVVWTSQPDSSGKPMCIYDRSCLAETVNEALRSEQQDQIDIVLHNAPYGGFRGNMRLKALETSHPPKAFRCSPGALQLFLGTVWPKLRAYGWQIGAEDNPDDIMFFSPGRKSPEKMPSSLKMFEMQKERKRIGAKHLSEIESIGLGHLTKAVKSAFANSIENLMKDEERGGDSPQSLAGPVISVKDLLERFLDVVIQEMPGKGRRARGRAQDITEGILACFDELAPMLHCPLDHGADSRCGENLGSEHLLRFLVLLPCLLKKSAISSIQLEVTTAAIQELTQYLAANCESSFIASILPSPVEYSKGGKVERTPFISTRISKLQSADPNGDARPNTREESTGGGSAEIVFPQDKVLLTDFTSLVMSQTLAYRASTDDLNKKGRSRTVRVGTPGLLCRHCKGASGEGVYFFSSADSFGTAAAVVHSHMNRCPDCPTSIKKQLNLYRARHAEQRKKLKFGSQARFFGRVWARLHDLPITAPKTPSATVTAETKDSSFNTPNDEQHEDVPHEFHSHVALLSYLLNTPGWMEREDMRESIELYYKCLKEGGELYMTESMPPNFNSEWILSKLAPRKATEHAKTNFLAA